MAVLYRKYQNNNESSKTYGKWYGRSVVINTVSTADLAEEISHATTVTKADILAVLAETTQVMKSHLQNSDKVVLDGLGSFKVGLTTAAANTSADFGAQNITGYHINYAPEVHFVTNGQVSASGHRMGSFVKDLLDGISAKEAPKNTVTDADSTDNSTDNSDGE